MPVIVEYRVCPRDTLYPGHFKTNYMIPANDLRIGNWILIPGRDNECEPGYESGYVKQISTKKVLVSPRNHKIDKEYALKDVAAIELTPFILVEKFGFTEEILASFDTLDEEEHHSQKNERDNDLYLYKLKDFMLDLIEDEIVLVRNDDLSDSVVLKAVHQLQNLYFLLYAKELHLKNSRYKKRKVLYSDKLYSKSLTPDF